MKNKRKFLTIITLAFVFASLNTYAYAQDRQALSQREAIKRTGLEARQEKPDNADVLRKQKNMAVSRLMETQVNRSNKMIEKLGQMIEKIEKVKDRLAEAGSDVSAIEDKIAKAKALKTESERLLAEAKSKHESLEGSETPRQSVKEFMTAMNNVKKKLIELHRNLVSIVKDLRALEVSPKETE